MSEPDTRTLILDVAQDLVQRRGANAMSYQDLSAAIGIRKASIHYHFPTKQDLIDALIERYHVYFLGLVDRIVADETDPARMLDRYIGLFEATLREGKHDKACLCGMLGAELASLGDAAVRGIRRFFKANQDRLATILQRGRDRDIFGFSGDPAALAGLIFAALEGAILVARAEGGVKRFRALADELCRLVGR
jgi:TetR/AcrR family transcriptional regulator, transcriptional repressor for nem operon